jgi:hypothetical protein
MMKQDKQSRVRENWDRMSPDDPYKVNLRRQQEQSLQEEQGRRMLVEDLRSMMQRDADRRRDATTAAATSSGEPQSFDVATPRASAAASAASMTDQFAATRAPPVERPTDVFEDAEEGEAEEDKPTEYWLNKELNKELATAVKTIEDLFRNWSDNVEEEVDLFLRIVKQVAETGATLTYRAGKFVLPITLQGAKFIMDNLYDKKYVFTLGIIGFLMGLTIPAGRDAGEAVSNWVLNSTLVQAVNKTAYTVSFGNAKMPPLVEKGPKTMSDEWRDAYRLFRYTFKGALVGLVMGGFNKHLIAMIRDWSSGLQGKHDIPQAEMLQNMSDMSLAIRSLAEQQKQQPQAPAVPIEIKLEMSDLAKALIAEMHQMRAGPPPPVPRGPALPFGVNPVRLPQGRRMALTEDDLPRGRMALTDDPDLRRRLRKIAEVQAKRREERGRPDEEDDEGDPNEMLDAMLREMEAEQSRPRYLEDDHVMRHSQAARPKQRAGGGRVSRGTKEVLNIPPPILEYFDVKNDPHFIRAHRPTAPK